MWVSVLWQTSQEREKTDEFYLSYEDGKSSCTMKQPTLGLFQRRCHTTSRSDKKFYGRLTFMCLRLHKVGILNILLLRRSYMILCKINKGTLWTNSCGWTSTINFDYLRTFRIYWSYWKGFVHMDLAFKVFVRWYNVRYNFSTSANIQTTKSEKKFYACFNFMCLRPHKMGLLAFVRSLISSITIIHQR